MLLTITYRGENAADLGFLLFKNPARPQEFELNFGKAYVFYPEVSDNICSAALLLDINPLDLARGKIGSKDGGLFDYVNDRPYVSSSFMSSAISHVFGTAMSGRCDKRPELVDKALDLTAVITMLPCKGDMEMLRKVFEPLGYAVEYEISILDEKYPDWGDAKYVDLTIRADVRLRDLLHHLYVLIPVFDRRKHYWIGRDEVEKLLRHGGGWLEEHPEKEFIANRYMGGMRSLARVALKEMQLDEIDSGQGIFTSQEDAAGSTEESESEPETPKAPNLNTQRLTSVVQALIENGVTSVIDLGCGEGRLISLLLKERSITKITGMDISMQVLERAKQRLKLDRMPETQRNRLSLFQGSLTYKDDRFGEYDAACVIEVIEHMDENRLIAFEQVLFGEAKPGIVIVTTPNIEFNENYAGLKEGTLRHGDHRFEWSREQFSTWTSDVASSYGYNVTINQIGTEDENLGAPTQMGVFTRCE